MRCLAVLPGTGLAAVMTVLGPAAVVPDIALAQAGRSVSLRVEETTGIRRTRYPVNARVPFPEGALARTDQVRVLSDEDNSDEEIPAQFTAASLWGDGSVQWLQVDFNVSIGPEATRGCRVEYGPGVSSVGPGRGLSLAEEDDAIQVGRVRFSKTAAPLLRSVSYRSEIITTDGSGRNGFEVEGLDGTTYALGGDTGVMFEVVRGGPLYVELRYAGRVSLGAGADLPFVVTVEMPNSKSWVKVTASLDDPDGRLRALSFHTPFAMGVHPWVWDFGTDRWTYGSLRTEDSSVMLTPGASIRNDRDHSTSGCRLGASSGRDRRCGLRHGPFCPRARHLPYRPRRDRAGVVPSGPCQVGHTTSADGVSTLRRHPGADRRGHEPTLDVASAGRPGRSGTVHHQWVGVSSGRPVIRR